MKEALIKNTWKIFFLALLGMHMASKACSPLNPPTLLSQSISVNGGTLTLNWQSTTVWFGCPDVVDVEIACNTATFSGLAAYTYTSAIVTISTNPQNLPAQDIDISNLCPGAVYKFRARHRNSGSPTASLWSSTYTFTTPGIPLPATLLLQPSTNVICPGQTAQITALGTGCGTVGTTYSWSPATGLSCVTCSNPVASPTSPINYTCVASSGQLGCWTQTAVVPMNVASPTVVVSSPSICAGETATITASGADFFYWSVGSFPSGSNTGGASPLVTTNYTVTGNTSGCTATALATVFVYPGPVIAVNNLTVCFNQAINLTATGGTAYAWTGPLGYTSPIQNPTITNAAVPMSGQYTVAVTAANGCSNTAACDVFVQALPTPTVINNGPVCSGTALTFTGTGASTYTWAGPNGFNSTGFNPIIPTAPVAASGIYTITGAIGTCTGSTTKSVTVKPLPVPAIFNNAPVCKGTVLSFTATGGVTYTWSGPAGFSSNSTNPYISPANAINAGFYTLTATAANGCTNSIPSNVVVNPLPVIPVNNLTVCLNSPVNLTSGGGVTYTWTGPNSFTSTAQNPVIPVATDLQSGSYLVTVSTAFGCTNSAVTSVTAVGLPTPTITSLDSLCAGASLTLSGSGGNSYSWVGPNGFSSAAQGPVINNVTAAATGIYTLVATVSLGNCSAGTSKSVTVMPLPIPAASNATICEKKSLQLSAGGGISYVWDGPNAFHNTQNSPVLPYALTANAGYFTYSLEVTGANLCKDYTTVLVTVYPNPTVQASGATVCNGQPAVLTSNGGTTYHWTGPNFTAATANATIASVNPNTIGTYVIMVGSVNSCTSVLGVNVDLIALPEPSVIVTPTACLNSMIILQAAGGDAYEWHGPNDFFAPHGNISFTATSMGLNGTYTLSAFSSAGCVGYTTAVITVYPLPGGILVSNNNTSCVPFCSDFTLGDVSTAPITSTKWELNSQVFNTSAFNYCFFTPGNYKVKGTFQDANGCINTSTFAINAYEVPVADFDYSPAEPVENIDEVLFTSTASGHNLEKWNWSFINNAGYKTTRPDPSYFFEEAGTYPVSMVVKNVWGCSDTVVKNIHVESDFSIFVPNVFTPNEDGKNETFQPKGRGVVKYDFTIFNRWGEALFHTNTFTEGWDGTFKDHTCKSDVYQWKINAADRNGKTKELSGHVTLYR